ncbi:MAG: VanW family protein [Gaiellales bacterium]
MSAGATTSSTAARRRVESLTLRRVAIVGVLAIVGVACAGLAFAGSPKRLAGGTTIAGLDVGGLTAAEATRTLEAAAERVERTPVTFTAGGKSWRLAATQLGVRVDWAAAVAAAASQGDGFGPVRGFRRLQLRLFGLDVTPPVSSFESVLAYEVRVIGKAVDHRPVEPSVQRRGLRFVAVAGRTGTKLDRDATAETIVRSLALLDRGSAVELPVATRRPSLVVSDLDEALALAGKAVSTPVTLKAGETRLRLPRWQIATLLRLPAAGRRDVTIGGEKANEWFAELQKRVNHPPVDATFRVRPGGIDVVPDRPGRALNVAASISAIERAVFADQARSAVLPLELTQANRSTADANAMGITGIVGSYTTTYGGTPGRLANVQLVAKLIDGALVEPGGTFSFNGTTGERNADKGFQDAPVIINGELKNGIGGGVCQVSTTVFNAAFEAGLPIGRRANHALYISHYPLGRDATVNYPDIDLTFSNDTGSWLLVRTFVSAGSLTVNLYGTPQHRRVESETEPLTVSGKPPIERTPDPELTKGMRVVDVVGTPPRETSVTRRVYDANGDLLFENTWRSYYVGEPTKVRVGTKPKPVETPPTGATGATGATGPDAPVSGLPGSGPDGAGTEPPAG